MRKVSRDDLFTVVESCREAKIPFEFHVNNNTYTIVSSIGKYFCTANKIPMRELSFVKEVKDYIKKNDIEHRIRNNYPTTKEKETVYSNIKYFDYKVPKKSIRYYHDLYEIDINAAYWDTALKLGIITPDLYKKGLSKHKKTRLAALGSLAKRTKIFLCNKIGHMHLDDILRKSTEYLWFKICEHLGKTMFKAERVIGNNFLFYWVDGIYVRGERAAADVAMAFEKDGYGYKVRKINWIEYDLKKGEVWVSDSIMEKDRISEIGYGFPEKIDPKSSATDFLNCKILYQNTLYNCNDIKLRIFKEVIIKDKEKKEEYFAGFKLDSKSLIEAPLTEVMVLKPLSAETTYNRNVSVLHKGIVYDPGPVEGKWIDLIKAEKLITRAKLEGVQLKKNRVFPLTKPKFRIPLKKRLQGLF